MNNTTRLADCAQILIGKNIDKAKTNEKEEGYPIIVGASDIQQGRICCKRYVVPENVKNPVLAKKRRHYHQYSRYIRQNRSDGY